MPESKIIYVGKVRWYLRGPAVWQALCIFGMALRGYELGIEDSERTEPPGEKLPGPIV